MPLPDTMKPWSKLLAPVAAFATTTALAGEPPVIERDIHANIEFRDARMGSAAYSTRAQRLQWQWRESGHHGFHAAATHRRREQMADTSLEAGAFRIWPKWIVSGLVEASPSAEFVPRLAAEGDLGYRVRDNQVFRAGLREARYARGEVNLRHLSWLRYDGNDEYEIGYHHGRLGGLGESISFGQARVLWDCSERLFCGARFAAGRNIFGVDPGISTGNSWNATLTGGIRLDGGNALRADIASGRGRGYRERLLSITFQYRLGP